MASLINTRRLCLQYECDHVQGDSITYGGGGGGGRGGEGVRSS